jgi:hypothetical protein
MAKAESEIYVRTNAAAEAERPKDAPFETAIAFPHVSNSFD